MLYVDASALVKLYLDEPGRKAVTAAVSSEPIVATQEIAYIEANAAFARAEREERLDHLQLERLRSDFHRDWPNYLVLKISQPLLERAVKLVDSFALRGSDEAIPGIPEIATGHLPAPRDENCSANRL